METICYHFFRDTELYFSQNLRERYPLGCLKNSIDQMPITISTSDLLPKIEDKIKGGTILYFSARNFDKNDKKNYSDIRYPLLDKLKSLRS